MAWRMLGQAYTMVEWPVAALEATMCQHDFDGRRLFQHRNMAKWVLRGDNPRIRGFRHEATCLRFLNELAELLSPTAVRPPAAVMPPADGNGAAAARVGRFTSERLDKNVGAGAVAGVDDPLVVEEINAH